MSRSVAALIVAVLGVVAAGAPAAADEPADAELETRARELIDSGQRHFDVGEYDEAIADYREAYRLVPRPGVLYNLGQAFRLKGDCLTASRMYRNYLRVEPASKHRALVEQHLEALAECAAEREAAGARVAATEGSELEEPPAEEPPAEEVVVAPPPEPEPPPPPPPPPSGKTRKMIGLAVLVTGGAALGAGGYFAVDARRAADEVSRGYDEGASWSELEETDARGRRSEVIGISLLAAGGVAVVCGATLYALGVRADLRRADAMVSVTPRGGSIGVAWRF